MTRPLPQGDEPRRHLRPVGDDERAPVDLDALVGEQEEVTAQAVTPPPAPLPAPEWAGGLDWGAISLIAMFTGGPLGLALAPLIGLIGFGVIYLVMVGVPLYRYAVAGADR